MRTLPGQAIRSSRKTRKHRIRLRNFVRAAEKRGDLKTWRRGRAVLGYLDGKSAISMTQELGVARASVNRWLQWYDAAGIDGLRTRKPPGRTPALDASERKKLTRIVENGPQAAGYDSGVWTGPMIGELIRKTFGVSYHYQHVPRLLHQLGFSVQRPRKRLARADAEAQRHWLRTKLPAIKKKPQRVEVRFSLKTRRVSGSMEPCTKRGHVSASSPE